MRPGLSSSLLSSLLLALTACDSTSPGDPSDAMQPADGGDPTSDGGGADAPPAPDGMTFFVTSIGNGAAGGDYGGLAGADARCQQLAAAVDAGDHTWHAYLSTDAIGIGPVVHARDRVGPGPWYNSQEALVAANVAGLHANGVDSALMLDEHGATVPNTEHDLLTGSSADGRVRQTNGGLVATCQNWTSNSNDHWAWVGHTNDGPGAWNDASHDTRCSRSGMMGVNGAGRLMCFAID